MGPTARKDGDGEQRYRTILETAARLFCERGYDATSMQEVADACRLTKAGLYHHIQSKEQLLLAIMSYGMDMFEQRVLAEVKDIADPVERLRECMRRNIHVVTRDMSKEVTIILHEHATLTGEGREYIDGRKKKYVGFLEAAIAQAVREGKMRPIDPTVGAFALLGMMLWIYKWYRPDGRLQDEQISQQMIDLFCMGALTPTAAAELAQRGEAETGTSNDVVKLFGGQS